MTQSAAVTQVIGSTAPADEVQVNDEKHSVFKIVSSNIDCLAWFFNVECFCVKSICVTHFFRFSVVVCLELDIAWTHDVDTGFGSDFCLFEFFGVPHPSHCEHVIY